MSTSNACQHAEGKGTEGTPHCAWRKELYSPINALTREHCKMPSGTSDSILLYLEDNQRLTHTSLADTQRSLKRLFEESSTVSSSSRRLVSPSRPMPQLTPQRFPDSLKSPIFTRPRSRLLLDQKSDERCFGPTALESLMLNIKDELLESPGMDRHAVKECVLQAQRKIDLLVGQGEEMSFGERSPPKTPPFAILDAMIEPYFTTVNEHFPIWTKSGFTQMATTLRQSTPAQRDLASIICCNNLILMAMSADSLSCHQRESMQPKPTRKSSSIDFDLIAGFLSNAKHAVNNIDQLVSPHLINVQALLSLHIVAQMYLSISLSETLFALATRCAKSIGIHQWHSFHGQLSDESIQERQNISYCLYVLDKAICWTAGSSPSISVSEVHFDPCLLPSENGISSGLVAKAEMARIEETVYLEIYAVNVQGRSEKQVREFATTISSRLQECLTESGVDMDKIQKSSEGSVSHLQLAIRYLSVQLLLIWPHKHHPDPMFQRALEVARMCLKLLLRLWHSPPDQESQTIFSFFLASLPSLYLYEVLSSILCGQGSRCDNNMLQEFVEMLQTITDSRAETSYNRRLYQLSLIVTDVIKARDTQHKRQKPTSQGSTNAYLMSELLSPQTSGYNYMNSEVPETFDSRFHGAVFPDPDSSFASMSPITSASGELARGPEELLPQLRSYAQMTPEDENFNPLAIEALGESAHFWKGVH
ncbi:putative fungal-specific transcription factor [Aspergillus tamarii]|uniref:Putative fungal-specific transcription factor n=1 Tax=Aspergillus tamarii TaxID=41984 RepID=A0A5N6UNT6_ASPTM|nr:putative fungal-specific transcription factor [Aspergillus tamarii]